MKFFKIEIQITLLTLIIGAAVAGSGYLVYKSLSEIIDSIHREARPDYKLLLIKDISSELSEVENSVRLFSFTGNENYIYKFRNLSKSVQEKLTNLEDYAIPESNEIQQIDSIQLLSNQKLVIWAEIRNLHKQKIEKQTEKPLAKLASKLDTAIIQPDTIKFEKPEKVGFFKRVFGKQDTTTKAPIIIDKSEEKEQLKQEIVEIEEQMSTENTEQQAREKKLLERNIRVTDNINRLIEQLEQAEQLRLETKTQEADFMAAQIYRRLVMFTGASILLLLIVLILFYRNLKKNKDYQNILKKARADAENLAKAKERFVATVSHEMRTPVNAIYGLSEQMLQRVTDTDLKTDLNIVYKSADHLITLVNDTLDFSKIESQKMTFEKIDFIPVELLQEVITLHQVPARAKKLELVLKNDIPENRVYQGDPVRLKQILINLFTNAIKFTEKGKITLEATEEKLAGHHYKLIVDVVDSGIGIPQKNIDKIFEEFVQLDGDNSQKHRGAGLGLAIVKKLVDLQEGKIKVKSLVGKGTRFTVEIPYAEGDQRIYQPAEQKQQPIPDWFKNLNLLLVDDEAFNLYLLKNILSKWGVAFKEAANGLEAVEMTQNEHFDLILMDMRMPVMDGFEASTQILTRDPNIAITMLTATNRAEDEERYKKIGIWDFLQKPFPERSLFELLLKLKEKIDSRPKPEVTQEKATPEFSLSELKKILGDDESFFKEMVDLFVISAQKCRESLAKSTELKDKEGLVDAAHKLAAPAKHMLANKLYAKLKELEKKGAENEEWPELEKLIREIDLRIQEFLNLLNSEIS
ncbi:hybrid sensor histidine kinase/response regulator [Mangrovibacterium diazotrophicum]|uniref:histidine kinase n=1 Tax=Mangrovibacterium diazotrophicum TaxID=1261403 RepID=A0A419VW87_9BACT|nr:ATP-binding protein [Mangrovibacterium diazotrophicum]RKD86336.1 signal transduction histidine kinase [Mangrovibacterium diazotrophicum]